MITTEAWEMLMKRFPAAYQFLLENALREEKRLLEAELDSIHHGALHYPGRKRWIEERLVQLRICFPD